MTTCQMEKAHRRVRNYMKGWRRGACAVEIPKIQLDNLDYRAGNVDGWNANGHAFQQAIRRFGMDPSKEKGKERR